MLDKIPKENKDLCFHVHTGYFVTSKCFCASMEMHYKDKNSAWVQGTLLQFVVLIMKISHVIQKVNEGSLYTDSGVYPKKAHNTEEVTG